MQLKNHLFRWSEISALKTFLEKKPIEGTNFEYRENLLKFMYFWTFLFAGIIGILIVFASDFTMSVLGIPGQDPVMYGTLGCIWMAMGLLSIAAIFIDPIRFLGILIVQITYKSIWFIGVIIPVLLTEGLMFHSILMVIIFATYIIGDIFAIPFKYLFTKR